MALPLLPSIAGLTTEWTDFQTKAIRALVTSALASYLAEIVLRGYIRNVKNVYSFIRFWWFLAASVVGVVNIVLDLRDYPLGYLESSADSKTERPLFAFMLTGFFLYELISVPDRRSPFWLFHHGICLIGGLTFPDYYTISTWIPFLNELAGVVDIFLAWRVNMNKTQHEKGRASLDRAKYVLVSILYRTLYLPISTVGVILMAIGAFGSGEGEFRPGPFAFAFLTSFVHWWYYAGFIQQQIPRLLKYVRVEGGILSRVTPKDVSTLNNVMKFINKTKTSVSKKAIARGKDNGNKILYTGAYIALPARH